MQDALWPDFLLFARPDTNEPRRVVEKGTSYGGRLRPWGLGACLGSVALAQVVFFVGSHTIFLSSFIRFDVLV
jgi:hypothetical protein